MAYGLGLQLSHPSGIFIPVSGNADSSTLKTQNAEGPSCPLCETGPDG